MKIKRISIKDQFADDRITRVAGEKLRHVILEADGNGEKIEIDFSDVVIASTSFLDEGIAKLALEGWSKEKIDEQVHLKKIHRLDLKVLNQIRKSRGT